MAASAGKVAGDPGGVAPHRVNVGCRKLDQALVKGALGKVVSPHPRWLEGLVRGEEVALIVGRKTLVKRVPSSRKRERPVCLLTITLTDPAGAGDDFELWHLG